MLEHTRITLPCLGGGHDRAAVFGDEHHALCVVADGAGSETGATQAANLVVETVRELWADLDGPLGPVGLRSLLERLDYVLLGNRHAGQSTAVIAEVIEDRFWGASVGDSAAWLVHDGHHLDLTQHQHRKWRLGSGHAHPVRFGPLPLVGTLVLGTDGLFECATPEHVTDSIRPMALIDVAGALVSTVRTPDGGLRDDLGMVLIRQRSLASQIRLAS